MSIFRGFKKVESAIGMGAAVTFVLGLASAIGWLVQKYILNQFENWLFTNYYLYF